MTPAKELMVRMRAHLLVTLPVLVVGTLIVLGAFTGCNPKQKNTSGTTAEQALTTNSGETYATATKATSEIEHGKYLVTTGGCNDCHTPFKMGKNGPEPDMSRMLSGHPSNEVMKPAKFDPAYAMVASATNTAFFGGWGTSYAANLTPDTATGIGSWSEADFVQTIRTGHDKRMNRPIMPPMPWMWYSNFTDSDLKSIYAYLHSIPKVSNKVPAYVPPAAAPVAAKKS